MKKLLAAHTPAIYPYPPYINVSEDNGVIVVTLRADMNGAAECGRTVEATFNRENFREFVRELSEKF